MPTAKLTVTDEIVISKIYLIRGQKVMIDRDLAELYKVENKQLKRAVRRHEKRFPKDFMFILSKDELVILRSQIDTSSWGGTRYESMAFTEQGVAMLSSVLNSDRAIKVNIQIIRIFTKMRKMLVNHKDLLLKMNELESKISNHDKSIKQIFIYLKQLIKEESEPRNAIGFKQKGSG